MFESFIDPNIDQHNKEQEELQSEADSILKSFQLSDDAEHNTKYFKKSTKYKCPPGILDALESEGWTGDPDLWKDHGGEMTYISPYTEEYDYIAVVIYISFDHEKITGQIMLDNEVAFGSRYLQVIDLGPLTHKLADDTLCDQTLTQELIKAARGYLKESREWVASMSMKDFAKIFTFDTKNQALRVAAQLFGKPDVMDASILLNPDERFLSELYEIPKGIPLDEIKMLLQRKGISMSVRKGMF